MRARAILREAWLNVLSGTSRALTVALALTFVTLAVQISDLSLTRQYVLAAEAFQASGASVQTVTAPGRIDPAACVALGELPSVRASGAVRLADSKLVVASLPQSPITLYEVTDGFPAVLHAQGALGSGLILSAQVLEALGDSARSSVHSNAETIPVRGSYDYPDDGRRPGFGFAALAVSADSDAFDECWVDTWPQNKTIRSLLLTSVVPGANSPDEELPVLASLNSTLGESFTGAAQNAQRVTRWAYPFAGLAALAICLFTTSLRRIEMASAMHSRVRRSDLVGIFLLETIGWLLPLGFMAVAVALYFATSGNPEDFATTLLQGAKVPAITVAAGLAGVVAGVLMSRESQLFRYFKSR